MKKINTYCQSCLNISNDVQNNYSQEDQNLIDW